MAMAMAVLEIAQAMVMTMALAAASMPSAGDHLRLKNILQVRHAPSNRARLHNCCQNLSSRECDARPRVALGETCHWHQSLVNAWPYPSKRGSKPPFWHVPWANCCYTLFNMKKALRQASR
ncbi:hypothetical protein JB92DRAFT_2825495 [Gautieria morchelliformis]|nr:hypothetical protein JB92DRAFT_2825495 [Gautieria morchelliformis]